MVFNSKNKTDNPINIFEEELKAGIVRKMCLIRLKQPPFMPLMIIVSDFFFDHICLFDENEMSDSSGNSITNGKKATKTKC